MMQRPRQKLKMPTKSVALMIESLALARLAVRPANFLRFWALLAQSSPSVTQGTRSNLIKLWSKVKVHLSLTLSLKSPGPKGVFCPKGSRLWQSPPGVHRRGVHQDVAGTGERGRGWDGLGFSAGQTCFGAHGLCQEGLYYGGPSTAGLCQGPFVSWYRGFRGSMAQMGVHINHLWWFVGTGCVRHAANARQCYVFSGIRSLRRSRAQEECPEAIGLLHWTIVGQDSRQGAILDSLVFSTRGDSWATGPKTGGARCRPAQPT